jgi:cyclase
VVVYNSYAATMHLTCKTSEGRLPPSRWKDAAASVWETDRMHRSSCWVTVLRLSPRGDGRDGSLCGTAQAGHVQERGRVRKNPSRSSRIRRRLSLAFSLGIFLPLSAWGTPAVQRLGRSLYAYVSDNDGSANCTFMVGPSGILVVDTGLNEAEGKRLLEQIRKISALPIKYIVNTHYHPDHQGANGVVGPNALVISSPFTRERTSSLIERRQEDATAKPVDASPSRFRFRLAGETLEKELTVYIGNDPARIVSPGPAHTMGDLYVYFPNQRTVAMGDLYLTNSSPAMDDGSVSNWIRALDEILALPADHFVPGHFEVGTHATVQRFRDYLSDLYAQVQKLHESGATENQARQSVHMTNYADFRQYPQFDATFGDNAVSIFRQLNASH